MCAAYSMTTLINVFICHHANFNGENTRICQLSPTHQNISCGSPLLISNFPNKSIFIFIEVSYFLKIYHHTKLQDYMMKGASIVLTSEVHMTAMFVLLMTGKLKGHNGLASNGMLFTTSFMKTGPLGSILMPTIESQDTHKHLDTDTCMHTYTHM
jgi:hypothetical protein